MSQRHRLRPLSLYFLALPEAHHPPEFSGTGPEGLQCGWRSQSLSAKALCQGKQPCREATPPPPLTLAPLAGTKPPGLRPLLPPSGLLAVFNHPSQFC